jgi:hypothetical protein
LIQIGFLAAARGRTVYHFECLAPRFKDNMVRSRSTRFLAAVLTVFSLLFAQLAVAAYACPGMNLSTPMAMAMNGADMPGCAEVQAPPTGLCQSHCDTGNQATDTPNSQPVAPFVATALISIVASVSQALPAQPGHAARTLLTRTTQPPLAIRNCCFRI